jgi:Kef-type K+ transport system membrane component KefB/mannitol/fructose-specific phosphotransferase system IIA component (Ntr-type)
MPEDPLFTLTIILVAGVAAGQIAKRVGLPGVTGQILAGILLGPAVLGLFHHSELEKLQPMTHFALGLIAVTVGSHLHLTRILVAKRRLFFLLLFESTVTPVLVFSTLYLFFDVSWVVAAVLAALAVETAPATVIALVREAHAKGVFVRTLMAAVALNNIATLCLFELGHALGRSSFQQEAASFLDTLSDPLLTVGGSAALGVGTGLILILATRRIVRSDHLATASMIAILLTITMAGRLELSSILACLVLGLVLANVTPDKEEIGDRVFKNFESAILAVFFTLAGAELDFGYLLPAGLLTLALVVSRIFGKVVGARLAMWVAGAPVPVQQYLGWALIPQAGLSVGLLLSLQTDPAFEPVRSLLLAVGLTSVLANELVGPIATRIALKRSGEVGKDRARVIDFLHEENITTRLTSDSVSGAIDELVALLWSTHRLAPEGREPFGASIRAHESEASSYLGDGLSIPHGELLEGNEIVGVMGISREGIRSSDTDERVHCIVLLATPRTQRDRHLEVLAAFARAIAGDRSIRHQLYEAQSPAHVYNLLHADEAEDFNYFLGEEEDLMPASDRSAVRS